MNNPTAHSTAKRWLKWLGILAAVTTVVVLALFAYLAAAFSGNFM